MPPMPKPDMLEAALKLAGTGWPVFPMWWPTGSDRFPCACGTRACPSPAKHPLSKAVRNGNLNATTDERIILDWWLRYESANVGIRTGMPAGIFVVDLDPRHGGM